MYAACRRYKFPSWGEYLFGCVGRYHWHTYPRRCSCDIWKMKYIWTSVTYVHLWHLKMKYICTSVTYENEVHFADVNNPENTIFWLLNRFRHSCELGDKSREHAGLGAGRSLNERKVMAQIFHNLLTLDELLMIFFGTLVICVSGYRWNEFYLLHTFGKMASIRLTNFVWNF